MEMVWMLAAFIIFVAILVVASYMLNSHTVARLKELASEFGSNVESKGGFLRESATSFEREGTRFTGRITRMKYACFFRVGFAAEPGDLHFQIKSTRSHVVGSYAKQASSDSKFWHRNTASPLAADYLLHSNDSRGFELLLADPLIVSELKKYDLSWNRQVEILYEAGDFELLYTTDPHNSEQKLRDVFRTAISFHDRLRPKPVH